MPRNTYFDNKRSTEQDLYNQMMIESINMFGQDMSYIPRKLVAVDSIIGEDRVSEFNNAYPIVAYFDNVTQFDGAGGLMSKFGYLMEQSANLIVSKSEWDSLVGRYGETILPNRPAEGDLIYFPLTSGLFEIKYVQHQDPFYQVGKQYVWKLSVELFQYSSEKIDTGVPEIDIFETLKTFDIDTTVNPTGQVISVNITNNGSGYVNPPNVIFTSNTGTGATATAILGTGQFSDKVVFVNVTNGGTGYQTSPTVSFGSLTGNNASATAVIDINIDIPDSFGDNNKFKNKAKPIIFDTNNPFGDL
jgi:hypothetical protein